MHNHWASKGRLRYVEIHRELMPAARGWQAMTDLRNPALWRRLPAASAQRADHAGVKDRQRHRPVQHHRHLGEQRRQQHDLREPTYLSYIINDIAPTATIVDNTSASFSVTGTWSTVSTPATDGFYGTNYPQPCDGGQHYG